MGGSVILAAALGGSIKSGSDFAMARSSLNTQPNYSLAMDFKRANQNIQSAINNLDYDPPTVRMETYSTGKTISTRVVPVAANLPDCAVARRNIDRAISFIGDFGDIDDDLRTIRNSLPNQDNLRIYNGAEVNEETFKSQYDSLDYASSSISNEIDRNMALVPKNMLNADRTAAMHLAGWIIAGLAGATVLIRGFLDYQTFRKVNEKPSEKDPFSKYDISHEKFGQYN